MEFLSQRTLGDEKFMLGHISAMIAIILSCLDFSFLNMGRKASYHLELGLGSFGWGGASVRGGTTNSSVTG